MNEEDWAGRLLATSDKDRRFELLAEYVTTDATSAAADGERLLTADDPSARELGADLLGQVATVRPDSATALADLLVRQLTEETSAEALASVVTAIGHTHDERARDAVLALADHADADVRFAVATTLPVLGIHDPTMVALRRLSRDADDDVRDWATIGLAESGADDEATIEALAARTDDPHEDTRAEAILGLARRHDPRARALVDRELAMPVHGSLIEEARDLLDA